MKAIQLVGRVDEAHQLHAQVPASVAPGAVQLLILVPDADYDDSEIDPQTWMEGIAREWIAELGDPRDDVYTLEDGKPHS